MHQQLSHLNKKNIFLSDRVCGWLADIIWTEVYIQMLSHLYRKRCIGSLNANEIQFLLLFRGILKCIAGSDKIIREKVTEQRNLKLREATGLDRDDPSRMCRKIQWISLSRLFTLLFCPNCTGIGCNHLFKMWTDATVLRFHIPFRLNG